jgi:hypothetical protein
MDEMQFVWTRPNADVIRCVAGRGALRRGTSLDLKLYVVQPRQRRLAGVASVAYEPGSFSKAVVPVER